MISSINVPTTAYRSVYPTGMYLNLYLVQEASKHHLHGSQVCLAKMPGAIYGATDFHNPFDSASSTVFVRLTAPHICASYPK